MTASSSFILSVALRCVLPALALWIVYQIVAGIVEYSAMTDEQLEEARQNMVTDEQRRQSLDETWNRTPKKKKLVGATVEWTPGDKREKVEREGRPTEYVRELPYKTKAEAWSKQK